MTETKIWNVKDRDGNRTGWSYGHTITLPPNFVFVPAGNAALTRRVKSRSGQVFIEKEKTKYGNTSTGVWAPVAMVIAARRSLDLDVPQSLLRQLERGTGRKWSPKPLDWRIVGF